MARLLLDDVLGALRFCLWMFVVGVWEPSLVAGQSRRQLISTPQPPPNPPVRPVRPFLPRPKASPASPCVKPAGPIRIHSLHRCVRHNLRLRSRRLVVRSRRDRRPRFRSGRQERSAGAHCSGAADRNDEPVVLPTVSPSCPYLWGEVETRVLFGATRWWPHSPADRKGKGPRHGAQEPTR